MKLLSTLLLCTLLAACSTPAPQSAPVPSSPSLPAGLTLGDDGIPLLDVHLTASDTVAPMDVETYLLGVVAGEMKNDWPMEALRAQAILARTFVLRFVSEKESRYSGADISTDITEAQAYNEDAVNDRIRQAVSSTRGLVLTTNSGMLPYTWFHAHSGGTTALAREALGWNEAEPAYTRVTDGLDSSDAPAEARAWSADFPAAEFLAACRRTGADPDSAADVAIYEKGDSGRAVTLMVDGETVAAAELRIALGSTVMRSTLLTAFTSDGNTVHMEGRGYGHGVGMPQWGAYALATDGFSGEEIALHYYSGLQIVQLW